MKRGVVYVAVGNPEYVLYAAASILSLHDSGYKGPISVFTDLPLSYFEGLKRENVNVLQVDIPKGFRRPSRWVKTRLAFLSPYDETLYLDADTVVLGSIEKIWRHLSNGVVALCLDFNPTLEHVKHGTLKEYVHTIKRCPLSSLHYNGGVMVWRSSKLASGFFNQWHREWKKFGDIDQLAIIRALQNTGVSPVMLPDTYNWNERRLSQRSQPVVYHSILMKQKLNHYFSHLYRRAEKLTGLHTPNSAVIAAKTTSTLVLRALVLGFRCLIRKRLQKLAGRNFAHRYKNL